MWDLTALLDKPDTVISASDDWHLYLSPHPLLRPYIAHYTVCMPGLGNAPPVETLSLVPDASGCVVFKLWPGGLSGAFWGPTTRTVQVTNDLTAALTRIFVEFRPCGAYRFTGIPQSETTDLLLPVNGILPGLGDTLLRALETATSFQLLTGALDDWFLSRLTRREDGIVAQLTPLAARLSVRTLSMEAGYSERHLSRLFLQELGMNIKTYARLVKVNHALGRMQQGVDTLTALAQEDWFDQAHFIRDFEQVCGVSPTAYLQKMSGFYNEPFKF